MSLKDKWEEYKKKKGTQEETATDKAASSASTDNTYSIKDRWNELREQRKNGTLTTQKTTSNTAKSTSGTTNKTSDSATSGTNNTKKTYYNASDYTTSDIDALTKERSKYNIAKDSIMYGLETPDDTTASRWTEANDRVTELTELLAQLNNTKHDEEAAAKEAEKTAKKAAEKAEWESGKKNTDYAAKSTYTASQESQNGGYKTYDLVNNNETAKANRNALNSLALAGSEGGAGLGGTTAAMLDIENLVDQMTDDERSNYNYIYSTQGEQKADEYLEWLRDDLESRNVSSFESKIESEAEEHPVASAILRTVAKPVESVYSTSGMLASGVANALSGNGFEMDQNGAYTLGTRMASTVDEVNTEQISQAVTNKIVQKARDAGLTDEQIAESEDVQNLISTYSKIATQGYGIAMSMIDNMYQRLGGGWSPETIGSQAIMEGITLGMMGSTVMAETLIDKKDEGMDDTRALVTSLVAGAAEILTEKVSLETLLDKSALTKNVGTYLIKNVIAEGSEEGASDFINWLADDLYDVFASQSESEWKQQIRAYMADGYSYSEATGKAMADRAEELGLDIAGGAISGGLFGVGETATNLAKYGSDYADMIKNEYTYREEPAGYVDNEYLTEAAEASGDEGLIEQANQFNANYDNGTATYGQLAQLWQNLQTDAENASEGSSFDIRQYANEQAADHQRYGYMVKTDNDIVADRQFVTDYAGNMRNAGQTAGATVFESFYDDSVSATDYAKAFDAYYELGRTGNEAEAANLPADIQNALTIPAKEAIMKAGGTDAFNSEFGALNLTEERTQENGREVSIRQGSERNDGTYSGEQVRTVEESAGSTVAESAGTVKADRGPGSATDSVAQSEEVISAKLFKGSEAETEQTAHVATGDYTEAMHNVEVMAKKDGLKVVFLDGRIRLKDGGKARGCIIGDSIYIQYNDREYGVEQIYGHERGHYYVKKGYITPSEVRSRIESRFGRGSVNAVMQEYAKLYEGSGLTAEEILEEIMCDALGNMNAFAKHSQAQSFENFLGEMKTAAQEEYAQEKAWADEINEQGGYTLDDIAKFSRPADLPEGMVAAVQSGKVAISVAGEMAYSRAFDKTFMDKALKYNKETQHEKYVSNKTLENAAEARAIAKELLERETVINFLPDDNMGKEWWTSNKSYGGSGDLGTICIRSLGAKYFMERIAEIFDRPLDAEETSVMMSHIGDVAGDMMPCIYCYVQMDRNAKQVALGTYIDWREDTIKNILDESMTEEEAYDKFLRYGTKNKRTTNKTLAKRFNDWKKMAENPQLVRLSKHDMASERFRADAIVRSKALSLQMADAIKYAQGASYAKGEVGFTAYNGSILKWKQSMIDNLNRQFGMRMYSFTDFHPAFILENMQMITDASVRGLKVLAYTKDVRFAKIFASTGANIEISVTAQMQALPDGSYAQDGMQGADWEEAKKVREANPNVGITFVAFNDQMVKWAMKQEWVDVVIPFHTVKSEDFVKYQKWVNYKGQQEDTMMEKGPKKYINPPQHLNDFDTFLKLCRENNIKPRFASWLVATDGTQGYDVNKEYKAEDNQYYMKLVNETRRSYADTDVVQPVFNMDAVEKAIDSIKHPFGTTITEDAELMESMAQETAQRIKADVTKMRAEANTKGDAEAHFSRDVTPTEQDSEYLKAVQNGDMETAEKIVREAAKKAGYDKEMFHETNAENIHVFDIGIGTHGATDSQTPYGIFTKSTNKKIGLGDRQMALYVKADNTLQIENREAVKDIIPGLLPYYDELGKIDRKYEAKYDRAVDRELDELAKWRDEHPEADMDIVYPTQYIVEGKPADIDSKTYMAAFAEEGRLMQEWKAASDTVRIQCKQLITDYLRNNGYDSMYLQIDNGSFGRQTDSLIVLDNNQVKSADTVVYDDDGNVIPPSRRFNAESNDIRFSKEIEKEYLNLAKNPEKNATKLREMVETAAKKAMPNTQILDENGNPMLVYHGTDAEFNVFDRTKARANMDIQGNFFSPWELDSSGYGKNVRSFYINLENPADEATGYAALNRFKGQNNAGVKARAYLESLGYDGVNNSNEEFIVFDANQIKSAELITYDDDGNVIPLSERFNSESNDVRYSRDVNSGYSGYSMSKRAVEAYENGEMPISKWSKTELISAVAEIDNEKAELLKKVNLKTLKKELLVKTSWHHTSNYFNSTDFYSLNDEKVEKLTTAEIKKMATSKGTKAEGREFRGDIRYLEWSGTRNHPKATEQKLTDVNIEERGSYYIVTDDEGKELLRKKIGSNGTMVTDYEQERAAQLRKEQEETEIKENSSLEAYAVYQDMKNSGMQRSASGNLYRYGQKPTSYEFENKLIAEGTQRLSYNGAGYTLEQWNGDEWENADGNTKYSRVIWATDEQTEQLRSLARETKQLAKQIRTLEDKLAESRRQTHLTKKYEVNPKAAKQIAEKMIDTSSAKGVDKAKLIADITELTNAFHNGTDLIAADKLLDSVVDELIEKAWTEMPDFGYEEFVSALKSTPIRITDELRSDFGDDWSDIVKSYFGKIRFVKEGGSTIDSVMDELRTVLGEGAVPRMYGQSDMLEWIMETLDAYSPKFYNPYEGYEAEGRESLGDYLASLIMNAEAKPATFADKKNAEIERKVKAEKDKADKKVAKEKAKGEEKLAKQAEKDEQRLAKMKVDYETKLAKLETTSKAKYEATVEKMRTERDQRLEDQKHHFAEVRMGEKWRKAESEAKTKLLKVMQRLNRMKTTPANKALIEELTGDYDLVAKSITHDKRAELEDLAKWFEEQEQTNPDFLGDTMTETKKKIERLSKKQIKDMNITDVVQLTQALLNLENYIRTANKMVGVEDRRDVYQQGEQSVRDILAAPGINLENGAAVTLDKLILTNVMRPQTFFKRIVGYLEGSPLLERFYDLQKGEAKMLDYRRRANAMFTKWMGNKKFANKITGKNAEKIELTVPAVNVYRDGHAVSKDVTAFEKISITPAMRISLYLHSLNGQNLKHIAGGGITIPDFNLMKKGKTTEAWDKATRVVLTKSQVKQIADGMTAEERAFANAIHDYFNGMSQEAVNETSLLLEGYALANVENYFPINTDKNFLATNMDEIKFDGTMENMGFTKGRVNASNPIMLIDAVSVLNRAITDHSRYYGLAMPIRNMNKVLGTTQGTFDEQGNRTIDSSVQQALRSKWGSHAVKYIDKLMGDIQSGHTDYSATGEVLNKLTSHYAGGVLELNASVAIKQAASLPTAIAVIGYKPVLKAMTRFGKLNESIYYKYSPYGYYRELGYNSQEIGDMTERGMSMPKALSWITLMDVETVRKLWKAAEYYVRDNYKNLTVGSDAYYTKIGEIHTQIITETQPNYTELERPQVLRSRNSLERALNMFKTQPFQNANILIESYGELKAAQRAVKASGSDADKNRLKLATKKFVWSASSQIISSLVFGLMQFSWDWFRKKDDKYKDEDGDYTILNWLKGIGINMASNAFGMLPFASTVYEAGTSFADSVSEALGGNEIFGNTFYGMEVGILSTLNDTIDDSLNALLETINMGKELTNGTADSGAWIDYINDVYEAANDFAILNGIPLNSVKNLLSALAGQILPVTSGYAGEYFTKRLTSKVTSSNKKSFFELLYNAYDSGDSEQYEAIYNAMTNDSSFGSSSKTAKEVVDEKMEDHISEAEKAKTYDQLGLTDEVVNNFESVLAQYDTNGGTTHKQEEVWNALQHTSGLTTRQKQQLWSDYTSGKTTYNQYLEKQK